MSPSDVFYYPDFEVIFSKVVFYEENDFQVQLFLNNQLIYDFGVLVVNETPCGLPQVNGVVPVKIAAVKFDGDCSAEVVTWTKNMPVSYRCVRANVSRCGIPREIVAAIFTEEDRKGAGELDLLHDLLQQKEALEKKISDLTNQ